MHCLNSDYQNNNLEYGIKCKNYELCECVLPEWWFERTEYYSCNNCSTWSTNNKGVFKITNNIECPICMEIKKGIKKPNCYHNICICCFKKCYYCNESYNIEPIFPYPDIQYEYEKDQKNPKWEIDYPLIKLYNEEWNKWDDNRQEKYEIEKFIRRCSICHK